MKYDLWLILRTNTQQVTKDDVIERPTLLNDDVNYWSEIFDMALYYV